MRTPEFLTRHLRFVTNVATMMSGRVIAAGIALVTMPIVARLFTPGDFGVVALFLSMVGIISNIAALRYEGALVLPKDEDEALTLMAFAYRVLFTFFIAMLLILVVYTWSGATLPPLELLGAWKWMLPLGVLLTTSLHIQESWLARKQRFRVVAASLVAGNSITSGTRIAFGLISGSSVYGLVSGNLLGMSCRLLIQKTSSMEGLRATFRKIGWKKLRRVAGRYADFPKLNAPAAIVSSLGQDLPVLLMGVMFSPAVAGFYAMANRLSRVPIEIVANSMRKVFLQKAAEVKNRGSSLRKAFLLATGGLALFGLVPLICISLFGQPLLTWLLGARWYEAGRYLEIMAPWLFMAWMIAPTNAVFIVLRKQRSFLVLQSVLTTLKLMAFGLAFAIGAGSELTLQLFVSVTVLGQMMTIAVAWTLITRHHASLSTEGSGGPALDTGARGDRD